MMTKSQSFIVAWFHPIEAISQIDLSSMGLEEVPASLRAFQGHQRHCFKHVAMGRQGIEFLSPSE
jgi:hypothetical protein